MTARKRSTRRRTPTKESPAPQPAAGEQCWVLDMPYDRRAEATAAGCRWVPEYGWVYVGATLPSHLTRWAPRPYSWLLWRQDVLNGISRTGNPAPDSSTGQFTLRPDQVEDVAAILAAARAGAPEFLLASDVGTGKTPVAVAAAKQLPGVRTILVVCPLSVAPGWRRTLAMMGDGGKRWCIINYESTKKLLTPPPRAVAAKKTATRNKHIANEGRPRVAFDLVITDESHALANPTSQQTRAMDRVVQGPDNNAAFVIRASATAGSNPAQLSYLHRGLLWRGGRTPRGSIDEEQYIHWCTQHNIGVSPSRYGKGLTWDGDPADLRRMHAVLFRGEPAWAIRRRPDWPEQQRIPAPVELTPEEDDAYVTEWGLFQQAMRQVERARARAAASPNDKRASTAAKTAREKGFAAQVRFRQKAGLLRAAHTAAFVTDLVAKGHQVAVSCEYLGTVTAILEELAKKKVPAVEFTGRNATDREQARVAFQTGQAPVIVFTPAEGFNLHAGETGLPGATTTPRATVVAEPRWSPKKTLQIEGRTHRDGANAPCYYTYAAGTIEEKVIGVVLDGMRSTGALMGDDTRPFDRLAEALGIPGNTLTA